MIEPRVLLFTNLTHGSLSCIRLLYLVSYNPLSCIPISSITNHVSFIKNRSSCILCPASCVLYPYTLSCILYHVSFIKYPLSCMSGILYPVFCLLNPELKTLECDILNPDLLINLEIKFMRKTSNI